MDVISVITAPTLRTKYTEATLAAIEEEGGKDVDRLICYDGWKLATTPDESNEWSRRGWRGWNQRVKHDGPSGTRHMMWWTFEQALSMGADRLLYMEDDLHLSRNAITRALAVDVPDDVAHVTFYDHKEFPAEEPRPTDGLHRIEGMGKLNRGMWGSLMMLVPRRTMEFVVQRPANGWHDPWPHKRSAGDCVLVWALLKSSTPRWAVHIPSLVDHVGEESSIEQRRVRKAAWFDGGANTP